MATNDFSVAESAHGSQATWNWLRDDRDTSSEVVAAAGDPLKASGAGGAFAVRAVDADFTVGTDQPILGIAQKASTETATVDGSVEVVEPLPGMVYTGRSLLATATDTDTEIDAMRGDYQIIDLTGTAFTVDTAGGSGASNALLIVGGDSSTSTLRFMFRHDSTAMGRGSA